MSYHGSIYSSKFHPLDLQIFGQFMSQIQAWRNENHTDKTLVWMTSKEKDNCYGMWNVPFF